MTSAAAAAPWEAVAAHDQLFVLITGANSGVGLGTAQMLMDDFLRTRSLSAHLILLPTTRNTSKSVETRRQLRAHAVKAAQTCPRAEVRRAWREAAARLHVVCLELDLCDLVAVRDVARSLCHDTVSSPVLDGDGDGAGDDEGEGEHLVGVRIPRLDSIVCNAAYGGWSGLYFPTALWQLATRGIVEVATWPVFKKALPVRILNEQGQYNYPPKPPLGEVFCACLFGHYMLAHHLLPLLRRPSPSKLAPGRIVFSSSLEALPHYFDTDDMQCLLRPTAYESSKRLTDLLALTATLPAAQPYSSAFLGHSRDNDDDDYEPPRIYLTHPGVVASTLFPCPAFLYWAYELALIVARWLGSPWHTCTGYLGAKAAAHITLEPQEALDATAAHLTKWGSSTDTSLRPHVKATEVQGWGFDGTPVDQDAFAAADTTVGFLRRSIGRRADAQNATAEDIAQFEELGARCWRDMEQMRVQWEEIMDGEKGT